MSNQPSFQPPPRTPLLALFESQRRALGRMALEHLLPEVLNDFLREVESQWATPIRLAVLVIDADGKHLRHHVAPSLPKTYTGALDGTAVGPASGCSGTAAHTGEAVFANDIATDPLWTEYRDLALGHGLRACWSIPVRTTQGRLIGVLTCYHPTPKSPSTADLEAMTFIAQSVSIATEQDAASQTRHAAETRHRQIFDSATDFAIIGTDLAGRVTDWNEGAQRVLGWREEEMLGKDLHQIFLPEDVAAGRPETELQCALRQGYAPDERWHQRKSGERFFAVGQLTPLRNDKGEVIGFVKIMRDRTAHWHAEEKLQQLTSALESEVEKRTHERDRLWRNSMDLLLAIGADGVLQSVNPAWTAILGYEAEELIGKYFAPFVHPEDIEATTHALAQAARAPLYHFEVRLRHKDGTYHWFEWRAAPEDGVIYANGRDVTVEKRQASQFLQANEARLNLALEAGEMGAWEWNPKTRVIRWLHGATAVHAVADTGEEIETSLDDYIRNHVHPDDAAVLTTFAERAISKRSNERVEYRIIWPDGSIHWLEVRGKMFFDEAGEPSQMVGVSVHITRRKRAEQDLRFLARASAELASLVDPQSTLDRLAYLAVPDFADWCAVDLLREDGTIDRVTVAHAEPKKVQLARDFSQRFPPDPGMSHGVWKVLKSGEPDLISEITTETLERLVTDPSRLAAMKELGFRSYIGVPLSAHGKIRGAVSFIAAESGRLYQAEDLALAEDLARRAAVALENADLYRVMRQSSEAKDVFLATLSHELRNPLAAIVGGLNLLALSLDDKKRMAQYVSLMERQANQLTRLVDDLMDVSRITTGKIVLRRERCSLANILNSAIETSRPYLDAGRHKLSVHLPAESTDLLADPLRLTQVFSNLLANAAKYTNPGGEIDVSLTCMDSEFIARVRDNGIGIAPDMLKNIFKIFTQVMHPIQRRHGGLGIGLSLVEGLVRMHGGSVEAHSNGLDRGSEFVVHLPRTAADKSPQMPNKGSEAARDEPTATRRILVVDDNVDAATTVADILGLLGHEVTTVHDGLSAVDAAAEYQPDFILLDIGLPGIDGYEAARRIRAQPENGRSPTLVALTGWGQEHDRQRAYQAGFDDHWVKPVRIEQLKEILERS